MGCSAPTREEAALQLAEPLTGAEGSLELDGADYVSGLQHGLVAGAALTHDRFVLATKRGTTEAASGTLQVTLFRLTDDGTLSVLGSLNSSVDVSTKLSVARVDDHRFVTAVRNGAGNYVVTAFDVSSGSSNLTITQEGQDVRGSITDIAVTSMNPTPGDLAIQTPPGAYQEGHVVVAHREGSGQMGLTDYSVSTSGALRKNGTAAGNGTVQAVTIATVPGGELPGSIFSRANFTEMPGLSSTSETSCTDGVDNEIVNANNTGDGLVDCADWDCCSNSACAGSATCTQGMVVTGTTSDSGVLKLIAWRVSAAGGITRLGDTTLEAATKFALTGQSYGRVATVSTTGAKPVVSLWNVDRTTGTISQYGDSYTAQINASNVRITSGNGARLFLQLSDGTGAGWLQTLEGVAEDLTPTNQASLRSLERIELSGTYWNRSGSLVSIGGDRALLPVSDSDQKLRVRPYRDYHVPLARGEFTMTDFDSPAVDPGGSFVVGSPLRSPFVDSSIAVGNTFAIACRINTTYIMDRAGNKLGGFAHYSTDPAEDCPPEQPCLFDSAVKSFRRHELYQFRCDPQGGEMVDDNQCVNEAFDTRCAYDAESDRFVVMSMLRGRHTDNIDYTAGRKDPIQRYVAIAVSKTSDPREGFNTYVATDNKPEDNPTLVAANGMAIVTHRVAALDGYLARLTPAALVFDVAALSAGQTNGATTKISQSQIGDARNAFVAGSGGIYPMGLLYREKSGGVDLYAFQNFVNGRVPVYSNEASFSVSSNLQYNAFVHMGGFNSLSIPPRYEGHFYFAEQTNNPDGGKALVVHDLPINAASVGSTMVGLSTGTDTVKTVECGSGEQRCVLPAIVAKDDKVVMFYGQHQQLESCPACPSGFCNRSGVCEASPGFPSLRSVTFSPSATGSSSVIHVSSTSADSREDGWYVDPSVMDRASAVLDPLTGDIWGLHETVKLSCTPNQVCESYDDFVVRIH